MLSAYLGARRSHQARVVCVCDASETEDARAHLALHVFEEHTLSFAVFPGGS